MQRGGVVDSVQVLQQGQHQVHLGVADDGDGDRCRGIESGRG